MGSLAVIGIILICLVSFPYLRHVTPGPAQDESLLNGSVASLVSAEGDVRFRRRSRTVCKSCKRGMPLTEGDLIQTGSLGKVRIERRSWS